MINNSENQRCSISHIEIMWKRFVQPYSGLLHILLLCGVNMFICCVNNAQLQLLFNSSKESKIVLKLYFVLSYANLRVRKMNK